MTSLIDADQRMESLLFRSGYSRDQIRRNESIWLPRGRVVVSPVVGFAREHGPYDTSTATVVGAHTHPAREQEIDEIFEAAFSLAAPIVLLADYDGVVAHALGPLGTSSFSRHFGWTEAETALPSSLNPRTLLSAKLGQRQTSLFPIDASLLMNSRNRTEEALGPRVDRLLTAAAEVLGMIPGTRPSAALHARAARLVIGALTAVVLRDKEFPDSLTSGALLDIAQQRHPQQYRWAQDLAFWETQVLDELIDQLSDIDFSHVEPLILSRIYETRLVDDAVRRNLGAHYTPPALAREMLRHLPIEELPPEERKVLDPTSGSGTLLLAAHDRLRDLQSANINRDVSHDVLVSQLHGTDIDPVAVGIANLSSFFTRCPLAMAGTFQLAMHCSHTPGHSTTSSSPIRHGSGLIKDATTM